MLKFILSAALGFILFSCQKSKNTEVSTALPPSEQQNDYCHSIYLDNIVGGQRVYPNDIDAMTTAMIISTDRTTKESYVCTATPISQRALITAAHCLENADKVIAVFHTDMSCSSGFRFNQDTIHAVRFRYHPNYNSRVMSNTNPDIGLVHLAADIKPGYPIYRINAQPEILNSSLWLYGYGVTGTKNSDSAILRKVILSAEEYIFEGLSIIIPENGLRGICLGDSGGPGFVKKDDTLEIASVNSFGYGPRDNVCGGRSNLILVYPFASWISKTLISWGEQPLDL